MVSVDWCRYCQLRGSGVYKHWRCVCEVKGDNA